MGSAEIGEAKGKFPGLSFRTYVRSAYIAAYADVPTYANVRMRVRPAPRIRPVRAITYAPRARSVHVAYGYVLEYGAFRPTGENLH